MKIRQLHPSDIDFHLFADVVKELYPADSIRHLQKDTVAADAHACFIAEENGRLLGKAALYLNQDLELNGKKTACVGNYEFADEPTLSKQFLEHLFKVAADEGAEIVIGPMNGSTWENYRFSLDHNAPPFLLEPYHHLYYNDQFLAAGFMEIAAYSSNKEIGFDYDFPEILELERHFKELGIKIRSIDLDRYDAELEKLYPFTERAFADNFLYSPLTWEDFRKKYREAVPIIVPEFVLLAEDGAGEIRGFLFAYPDLLNKMEKTLVVKTLARDPEEKWKGLGSVLANNVLKAADRSGFVSHIHAFMKDTNRSVRTSEKFNGEHYKRYSLYGKEL